MIELDQESVRRIASSDPGVARATANRLTAEERREDVLEAAAEAFARRGLYGTSTEEIASAAGISQPYLFRLFGTKKALYLMTVERCMARTLDIFRGASRGLRGEEALRAMGRAYHELVLSDRGLLLQQMHACAACDDPEIRAAVRGGFGQLLSVVEAVADLPRRAVTRWFADGMLLSAIAAMGFRTDPEPWVVRLMDGCEEYPRQGS